MPLADTGSVPRPYAGCGSPAPRGSPAVAWDAAAGLWAAGVSSVFAGEAAEPLAAAARAERGDAGAGRLRRGLQEARERGGVRGRSTALV